MHYDEILTVVGEFGRYQKVKFGLICLMAISVAAQAMVSIFTIYTPKHRCQLPLESLGINNFTDSWSSQSYEHQVLVDQFIPVAEDGGYSSCDVYTTPKLSVNHTPEVRQCDSWVYDDTEMITTVVTRMNLVCDKKLLGTIATSSYMFGNLVGSLGCGILSDLFGRKKMVLTGAIGQLASGIVLSFTPEFYSYAIFRFFIGIFNIQIFLCGFVIAMELVGPSKRLLAGVLDQLFWGVGFILLILIAYIIRKDGYIQLAITLPSIFFISYYWLLPESARWLLAKRRIREAEEIIHSIAKTNETEVPEDMELELEQVKPTESVRDLARAATLLYRTIIVFFNWFVISLAFYGLSLNSGNMPGSLYVNTTFSAVAENVGYLICFLCFVLGRKLPHVVSMVTGGLACIASIAVYYGMDEKDEAKNWMFLVLNNLGKVGVTVGFSVIYLWCAEIFPTLMRNSLMGFSSTCARVGSIVSPYIADLGKVVPPQYSQMLPPLIFGVLTAAGGLSAIGLPETTGYELPETIAQANVFPRTMDADEEEDDVEHKL